MSFASEKLQKGYLRRKMSTIASKVKVREIIAHLPCLTDHDRENIEAKRENNGNFDGMMLLLECLKRRENWPEQLIEALEACEQQTIAAEIRAEYDALRGINSSIKKDSNPSPPSATVISAHVHPPPSGSHLPTPESGKSQATVAPSAEAPTPLEPVAHTTPQPETPVHAAQSPAAQIPRDVLPPKPPRAIEIEVAPLPSTPPPSPEIQHTGASTPPPLQREVNAHQEPEENSESDIQDMAGGTGVTPDQVSTGNGEVNSVVAPPASCPVEQSETDTLSCSESLQTTSTITEIRAPQSPPPTQTNSHVTDRSSFPILTPEKPPVQDTTPLVEKVPAVVLEPEETSEPQTTQVAETNRQTTTAATASPLSGAAVVNASHFDDSTVCLSKPGQLISIQPQNHGGPNILATNSPVEPYSGNTDRLEMSDDAQDTVNFAHVPACSAVSSTPGNTVSGVPYQENGIALNPNEPEENHYESPCQSLERQDVRVNVVHVSGEVSILNLDGQTSSPQAQISSSDTAKKITSASPLSTTPTAATASSLNAHSSENYSTEPVPVDISSQSPDPEESGASWILTNNTKYIATAAGVAALALLITWKLKN